MTLQLFREGWPQLEPGHCVGASLHHFGLATAHSTLNRRGLSQIRRYFSLIPRSLCPVWQMKVPPGRVISSEPITAWCPSAAASQPTALCWPSASRRWWPSGARPPGSCWPPCRSRPKPSGQSHKHTHTHTLSPLCQSTLGCIHQQQVAALLY